MARPRQQLLEIVRWRLDDKTGTLLVNEGGAALGGAVLPQPLPHGDEQPGLGSQAIYRGIHAHSSATTEQLFFPDDLDAWRGEAVFGLGGSGSPQARWRHSYEPELSVVFELLSLAGIEPKRETRDAAAPLIVAGGPLTSEILARRRPSPNDEERRARERGPLLGGGPA